MTEVIEVTDVESLWQSAPLRTATDGSVVERIHAGVQALVLFDGDDWRFTVSQSVPYAGRRVLVEGYADTKEKAVRVAEKWAMKVLTAQLTIEQICSPDRPIFGRAGEGWSVRINHKTYQAKSLKILTQRVRLLKSWEVA